eukprot:CAMPEP_0202713446 /NCGR_PEP_ID=MMETSP1385-20130828/54044_1 /ASSEMBLY_ACC=CAM_ASM_000861 /TAXON_ID=933848 /ORGANISM="Elphidium margaritaceum" /LENGTH=204 /DNA_ID=CAMNT_0049373797 /DNA_START=20 /DNA_END=634 /DNA_ORIENTATION=+
MSFLRYRPIAVLLCVLGIEVTVAQFDDGCVCDIYVQRASIGAPTDDTTESFDVDECDDLYGCGTSTCESDTYVKWWIYHWDQNQELKNEMSGQTETIKDESIPVWNKYVASIGWLAPGEQFTARFKIYDEDLIWDDELFYVESTSGNTCSGCAGGVERTYSAKCASFVWKCNCYVLSAHHNDMERLDQDRQVPRHVKMTEVSDK